jgi:hypothetical protein
MARGNVAARDLRRRRHVEAIWLLGARVIFELIDELDRHFELGEGLDRRLARYAALDHDIVRLVGGDRFPPSPLHLVVGGRR